MICSLIAYHNVAFRMDKLRRLSRICKISRLNNFATLLPCCLRLTQIVTNVRPRLANGGSLHLSVWDFHPLNYPPFSGRTYPFTAPTIMPPIKNLCKNGYTSIIGSIVTTTEAICILSANVSLISPSGISSCAAVALFIISRSTS